MNGNFLLRKVTLPNNLQNCNVEQKEKVFVSHETIHFEYYGRGRLFSGERTILEDLTNTLESQENALLLLLCLEIYQKVNSLINTFANDFSLCCF